MTEPLPLLTTEIFSDRLTTVLKLRGLTYEECAKRAELSPSHIGHYALGTRLPSAINLAKLARALDISPDFLLGIDSQTFRALQAPPRYVALFELAASMPSAQLDLLLEIARLFSEQHKETKA